MKKSDEMIYGLSWFVVIACALTAYFAEDGITSAFTYIGFVVFVAAFVALIEHYYRKLFKRKEKDLES